jgi:hypothetical protein
MVVEFAVDGNKASGKIAVLGRGGFRTYKAGEEILRLEADDYGDWVGQLHWRGPARADHWDSIRFVATPDVLDATMTTDLCYRKMPRVNVANTGAGARSKSRRR